jgi:hypothetical protein
MRYLNLIEPEECLLKNIARSLTGLILFLMKFIAKAAIPDAEGRFEL